MTTTRDGRIWPRCPDCSTIWRQSGNRTGHCSECHETFQGSTAFDAHRIDTETGRTCRLPDLIRHQDGRPVLAQRVVDDGLDEGTSYWSIAVTDEQRAAFEALNADRAAARTTAGATA